MKLNRDYPHLLFKKHWEIKECELIRIGQCVSSLKAINNTPIVPQYYDELMLVALTKGAQATTAIEGNTLTVVDIHKLQAGEKLPASLEYQGIEVQNILDAFNTILHETIAEQKEQLITRDLLLRFHKMVGKNLGDHFAAVPGRFRENDVIVGTYRCPDYRDVPELIDKYCAFLMDTFIYEDGQQRFSDLFFEAIVAHVYLEWIHPFGDGNGRTGRLIEFYILSRGGNPDITLHVLSNYYNLTRPEYYRQIEKAFATRDLTEFIAYALLGFRDGLQQILEKIQASQLSITWQKYVYDKFNSVEMGQKEVFKRKRTFALEIPVDKKFIKDEIPFLNIALARLYSNISIKTLERDIDELLKLEILIKEDNFYFANISALNKMIAKRKGLLVRKN
jgi:Fic family protein